MASNQLTMAIWGLLLLQLAFFPSISAYESAATKLVEKKVDVVVEGMVYCQAVIIMVHGLWLMLSQSLLLKLVSFAKTTRSNLVFTRHIKLMSMVTSMHNLTDSRWDTTFWTILFNLARLSLFHLLLLIAASSPMLTMESMVLLFVMRTRFWEEVIMKLWSMPQVPWLFVLLIAFLKLMSDRPKFVWHFSFIFIWCLFVLFVGLIAFCCHFVLFSEWILLQWILAN